MRTLDEILLNFKSNCFDCRDIYRLFKFIPWDVVKNYPYFLKHINKEYQNEEKWMSEIYEKPYTRENILEALQSDVAFGFEKALDRRGLSAGMMFEVVRMWNWVLNEDDELTNWSENNYAMYGLPLFKATAVKYGFPNEIGDDNGDESWYNEEYND